MADPRSVDAIQVALGRSAQRLAQALSLGAAPAFAALAVLMSVLGDGSQESICGLAPTRAGPSTMVTMYAMMSAFNLAPWLKLIR
jgi:hypothetical protein